MKYLSLLFISFAVFALTSCLPPFQPVTVPEHKVEHHEEPPRPEYHHEEPPPPPEYHHEEPPRPEYHHDAPTRAEDVPRIVSGHEEEHSHEPEPPR
ncbi:MAG: hypothetical protein LUC37_06625 [Prevotella sp.]|nr:hypothetical protein [Prevotella sp.]